MYMDGLKYQNTTLNRTLKFSLKGPVRTHHYLNTYIRFDMEQQTMTNEQFALWMANQMIHSNIFETADRVYEWLESKKPQQAELKHYLNGVEVPEQYWGKLNK